MSTASTRYTHRSAAGGSEAHPARETVAVTGADSSVGRGLLAALPPEFRRTALVPPDGYVPAECIVGAGLDSPYADEALRRADVVVHLAGGLGPRRGAALREANLATATRVAAAVREGRARRLVFLSHVRAESTSNNEYLALKGRAEDILGGTGKELVVFRCTHIIGTPEAPGTVATTLLRGDAHHVTVFGNGMQRVAPIYRGDVVSALVAATRVGPPGTYGLAGPQEFELDELVRLLNRSTLTPLRHVPPPLAIVLGGVSPSLPASLVDLMLRDSVADSTSACGAFGLTLTRLDEVWR
jgi:nucleoside-diphosphate-sugar epimerase